MINTLTSRFSESALRQVALSFVGFGLIAACSQISIPIQPIPITLQTVAVILIGLTFNTRTGLAAVAMYLCAAAMGVPVLSDWSGGWAKLSGASAGYLFGFFAAVLVMSYFRRFFKSRSFGVTFINCLLGTSVIFVFGIAWLSRFVGFSDAITFGLLPFIFPGAIKALLLCGALRFLR